MTAKQKAKELINFIGKSVSPYHAVLEGIGMLRKAGFEELPLKGAWKVKKGGRYYISPYATGLFAFSLGDSPQRFRIVTAHTDNPCLHLKPKAELSSKGYLSVNAEIYGGPILNTWLDRPLSLAGRVSLRSGDIYKPELRIIDFARPLLTIPNLAVHYNREVNKGVELKKQIDMLPLLGIMNDNLNEKDYFADFLAKEMKVEKDDILDFDLYVYNIEKGCYTGLNEEFISAPRLDNLTSCFASLCAITEKPDNDSINVIALFDNEEVGCESKQGADSTLLPRLLRKLYCALGKNETDFTDDILDSFLLSADVAHALHPNHTKKYDPVNYSLMNDGVVLKLSCNQRYTYDTEAVAIMQQLLDCNNIKYKKFVNNSDMPGGGTQGPVVSSILPMKTVDVGVPILAMHSCREMMGTFDQLELEKMLAAFFSC